MELLFFGLLVLLADGLVESQGFFPNYSTGDSMLPALSECSFIVVNENIAPSDVVKGDIVSIDVSAYTDENRSLIHRVAYNSTRFGCLETKGDNVPVRDFCFDYEYFNGRLDFALSLPASVCSVAEFYYESVCGWNNVPCHLSVLNVVGGV